MRKAIIALGICAAMWGLSVCAFAQTEETTELIFAETADISAEIETPTDTDAQTDDAQSPATGLEGIALVAGTAIAAGGIILVATKKK